MALNFNHTNSKNINDLGNICGIDFSQDAIFLPAMYGIFFIVGTPLNVLALAGLYRLVKTEKVVAVYVMNLLLADLIQLFTLPMWMDYYKNGHYWRYGPGACQFMGYSFYISVYVAIFLRCIIALERHLAIARPWMFQGLSKLKVAGWLTLGVWVLIAVPPSAALNKLFPVHENYTLCIEKYPSEGNFITYKLITLLLSFIVPLTFILVLHIKTLRSLMAVSALPPEEKKRIKDFLTLLVVAFIIVLGPYHFIGCVKYVGLLLHSDACAWEKVVFVPYQLGRGLLSLNSLLDPVLYMFLRNDFRSAVGVYVPCLQWVTWGLSQPRASVAVECSTAD
ncbi:G-protein coupled receptor 4 [Denticeps clupeoides]|uniref:G-protein coupled receptors family 1 profile domain-containing protein n=1 Tax=Denticeps clupeoides TaxID=299321 RepID=A0AAY4BI16_9TELE|nr:G-protein coupled receptor 4-like [Denticeps clupeoides]